MIIILLYFLREINKFQKKSSLIPSCIHTFTQKVNQLVDPKGYLISLYTIHKIQINLMYKMIINVVIYKAVNHTISHFINRDIF